MKWNGNPVAGKESILKFLENIPECTHVVDGFDAHPVASTYILNYGLNRSDRIVKLSYVFIILSFKEILAAIMPLSKMLNCLLAESRSRDQQQNYHFPHHFCLFTVNVWGT